MQTALRQLAVTAGGEGSARLGRHIGLGASPDTFLRLIRSAELSALPRTHAVGLDEWAWRKQRQYGAIVVDLETHRVLELLPDDSRTTITAWLQQHPEIDVVSRDRSGPFAAAARDGAPQAQQVADRFHLVQDLSELLRHVFERHSRLLEPARDRQVGESGAVAPTQGGAAAQEATAVPANEEGAPNNPVQRTPSGAETLRLARLRQRQERYAQAHRLAKLGLSKHTIAEQLGVDAKTVRHWLSTDSYPAHPGAKGRGRPLGSQPDSYKPYLLERYQQGCHNSSLLYRELVGRGYKGRSSLVRKWFTGIRHAADPTAAVTAQATRRYSLRDRVFSVMRLPADRTEEQAQVVLRLAELGGVIGQATDLAQGFAHLVRQRQEAGLTAWMEKAEASGLDEFKTFVNGLRRDEAAVRAGLSLDWNNGPTEGNNNRLKLVKRSMFGRANFDLLRKRILLAA
jgi:transposase